MHASQLVKALQKRIDLYGDCKVVYREEGGDDQPITAAFGDCEEKTIVITTMPIPGILKGERE